MVARVVLVVAALSSAFVERAAAAPADLGGTWLFVPQRSDDVRDQLVASLGPDYAKADARGDAPRLWIRDWLVEQAELPKEHVLTVEQDAAEFRVGIDDDLRVYYFGREAARRGPGGALLKATVRREDDRVVVEEKAVKGSGHVVESYELQDGGRSLLATWRVSHKGMREPFEVRLAFRRAQ